VLCAEIAHCCSLISHRRRAASVAEVPDEFGPLEEFVRIFTALPSWADGLPLAAKVREGARFAKITTVTMTPQSVEDVREEARPERLAHDHDIEARDAQSSAAPRVAPDSISRAQRTTLVDLIGNASDPAWSGKVLCPFHDDRNPSLHLYDDDDAGHYHCFVCGAHGSALDYLMRVEGLDRAAAMELLTQEPGTYRQLPWSDELLAHTVANRQRALALWDDAKPIEGTLAERYLAETRRIDLAALPNADACLRFHPRCPFGFEGPKRCLIALRRDVLSDDPVSIQRITLTADAGAWRRRQALSCRRSPDRWRRHRDHIGRGDAGLALGLLAPAGLVGCGSRRARKSAYHPARRAPHHPCRP
jgi:hypothetical protein